MARCPGPPACGLVERRLLELPGVELPSADDQQQKVLVLNHALHPDLVGNAGGNAPAAVGPGRLTRQEPDVAGFPKRPALT